MYDYWNRRFLIAVMIDNKMWQKPFYTDSVWQQNNIFNVFVLQQQNMGNWNCKKRDGDQTVTNFEEDKWSTVSTTLHPLCFILKNNYQHNLKLMKWISSLNSKSNTNQIYQKICKYRQQKKPQYLPVIYQQGQTMTIPQQTTPSHSQFPQPSRPQKQSYMITQQLVSLQHLSLTQLQATIVSYKTLQSYSQLLKELNGFVALEGIVKVWFNQNLSNYQVEFPYPNIDEQEFVGAVLRHVFNRVQGDRNGVFQYVVQGGVGFEEAMARLSLAVQQSGMSMTMALQKEKFQKIIQSYQGKNKLSKKQVTKLKGLDESTAQSTKLKFLVADTPSSPTNLQNEPQPRKQYIKDYSQKHRSQFQPTNSPKQSSSLTNIRQQPILMQYSSNPLNSSNFYMQKRVVGMPMQQSMLQGSQVYGQYSMPVYVSNQM